jgi:formylglycine-generating enzyme required for sulfatase activity
MAVATKVLTLRVPAENRSDGAQFSDVLFPFVNIPEGSVNRDAGTSLQNRYPFWMLATEVTEEQWQAVADGRVNYRNLDSEGKLPKVNVSYNDCVDWLNKMSQRFGMNEAYTRNGDTTTWQLNSAGFRLPTGNEWEFAARGGTSGDTYGPIDDIAWYSSNSNGERKAVGQKLPNAFGLYDMLGNVWEWVFNSSNEPDRDYYANP